MKKVLVSLSWVVLLAACRPSAETQQSGNNTISATEAERLVAALSSDDMQGRKAGTPGIEKAASLIEAEFKAAGLQPMQGLPGFRQEFSLFQPKHLFSVAAVEGKRLADNDFVVITHQPSLHLDERSGFEKAFIKADQNLFQEARKAMSAQKNLVVVVDTAHRKNFGRLTGYRRLSAYSNTSVIFLLSQKDPASFAFNSRHTVVEVKLANIIGILPGKSRKDELVVFSAHYDHLGIGKPTAEGDSIYNGANDNASGTSAVLMLAREFARKRDNERSVMFVAFTAEEMGLLGSQYFGSKVDPATIVAMLNLEMIGTESKWGADAVYVTGYDKSDLGAILNKAGTATGFTFHPDPYKEQDLFLRSDNASLARLGVPAHTISSSKMDVEKYYHSADDEISTLNMNNMAAIVRAIATSARAIISGSETPSRVKN